MGVLQSMYPQKMKETVTILHLNVTSFCWACKMRTVRQLRAPSWMVDNAPYLWTQDFNCRCLRQRFYFFGSIYCRQDHVPEFWNAWRILISAQIAVQTTDLISPIATVCFYRYFWSTFTELRAFCNYFTEHQSCQ